MQDFFELSQRVIRSFGVDRACTRSYRFCTGNRND